MKIITILLIFVFFFSKAIYANESDQYNQIIENLRCLVCQNQSLAESDSNLAKDLRQKVKKMLETGKTDKEIYKFMSDRYTDYVLYNPPLKKSTWFLWYSPFLILFFSLGYLFWSFKTKKSLDYKRPASVRNDDESVEKIKLENKKNYKAYIFIFIVVFIPVITLSIYSYSSELVRYKIAHYFESKEPVIDITILIHDDILSKITGNEVLFVYARRSNGMRVPLAIDIFDVVALKKNYNIKLDNTMNMIEGQTLSSAKEIIVEARISRHKKAMTSPGDYIGRSKSIALKSSNYLLIRVDSIVAGQ